MWRFLLMLLLKHVANAILASIALSSADTD